jgi:hypothetical protein
VATATARPGWGDYVQCVAAYQQTADEQYAARARGALLALEREYGDNPQRHLHSTEEALAGRVFWSWDVIEEASVFSEDERRRFSNMLLATLLALQSRIAEQGDQHPHSGHLPAGDGAVASDRTADRLLGLYYGARYFQHHYGDWDPRWADGLKQAAVAFERQGGFWLASAGAPGTATRATRDVIEYALASGDRGYLTEGNLARAADYHTLCADNTGRFSALGDPAHPEWQPELDILPLAFWFTRDGRTLWRLDQLTGGRWPNPYWPGVPPQTPRDLCGVVRAPLGQGCDKISFRTDFDRDSQYLLLGGNAILAFCDRGRQWLGGGGPAALTVQRDGRPGNPPSLAVAEQVAGLDQVGLTRTRLPGYNGTDWWRNILWAKGKHFVVFDEVRALESGEYDLRCAWTVPDVAQAELQEGRLLRVHRLAEKPAEGDSLSGRERPLPECDFFLITAGQVAARLRADAPGATGTLEQVWHGRLARSEEVVFQNLLYTTAGATRRDLIRRSDRSALVTGPDPAFVAVGGQSAEPTAPLRFDAALAHLSPSCLSLAGCRALTWREPLLTATQPVDVEFDLARGRLLVKAAEATDLAIRAWGPITVDGRDQKASRQGALQQLRLPMGEHVVTYLNWRPPEALMRAFSEDLERLR